MTSVVPENGQTDTSVKDDMTTAGTAAVTTAPVLPDSDYDTSTEGVGWLFFAGTVLGLAGIMRIIDSIWAFGYHGQLPNALKDGALGSDLKNYAWLWLIVGLVLIGCSVLVVMRSQFARWVGIVAAAIGSISAMVWMPYYPVWALVYVGLGVLVIYALTAHGGRESG